MTAPKQFSREALAAERDIDEQPVFSREALAAELRNALGDIAEDLTADAFREMADAALAYLERTTIAELRARVAELEAELRGGEDPTNDEMPDGWRERLADYRRRHGG